MKRILFTLVLFLGISLSAIATDLEKAPYKNINEGEKITYTEEGHWVLTNKKSKEYFTKQISSGTGSYSEFYSPEGEFLFSTGCTYEFIYEGNLIGYSNHDLKFYQFWMVDGILQRNELTFEEIESMFKDFKIVKISDFSSSTNSLKLKKDKKHFKILLWNDTDRYFYHYGFTSNNAKFNRYPIKGMLDITKKGMIQFSHFGDNTKENPWFIILVR